jgi:hypothetical protein
MMRLSRGWFGLAGFWFAVVGVCLTGAGALEMLGAPRQDRELLVGTVDPAVSEFVALVPATMIPHEAALAAPVEVAAAEADEAEPAVAQTEPAAAQPEPAVVQAEPAVAIASLQPRIVAAPDREVPAGATASDPDPFAAPEPDATDNGVRAHHRSHRQTRRLHIRIVRSDTPCASGVCTQWRVIRQRAKPDAAPIDIARLHLAPSLRAAAEGGEVELVVNAVERHATIKGRDTVVISATSLAGVTPHDR